VHFHNSKKVLLDVRSATVQLFVRCCAAVPSSYARKNKVSTEQKSAIEHKQFKFLPTYLEMLIDKHSSCFLFYVCKILQML
jgi:hypothetical protein